MGRGGGVFANIEDRIILIAQRSPASDNVSEERENRKNYLKGANNMDQDNRVS